MDLHTFLVLLSARAWFWEDPNQGVEALLRDRGGDPMQELMRKSGVRHMTGACITSDEKGLIPWVEQLTMTVKALNHQRPSLR
jgi:hypothetical protein